MASRYRWDDFVLDLDAYRLERGGTPIALEPKALNLLTLVVQKPGHLFTKQEIFEAVWPDTAVTDHALTRVVAQLRRALGDEAREARYIETVPTRGYRWIRPVQDLLLAPAETPDRVVAPARNTAPDATPPGPTDAARDPSPPVAAPATRRGVFGGLAAALGVATAVFVALVWLQPATPTSATARDAVGLNAAKPAWPVQVTTHDGLDLHPSLSPRGDAIAFASDRTGGLEIYIRGFDGPAIDTPLTADGGQNIQPAWSPDGRWIAYHSSRQGGIWIVPARGGVPRQVTPRGSNPAWSPDGRRLAFQSDEHTDVTPSAFGAQSGSTLWMVDADGANLHEITNSGSPIGGHAAPTWSADARFLAFTVFDGGSSNGVWLLALDTGETRFLDGGKGFFELVFAPDSSALYVAGGAPLIARLPFDARRGTIAGPRTIIPVAGAPGVRGLSISPDGQRLAFAGLALSSQIWSVPVDRTGAPRGDARALTTDTSYRKSLPAVSPDGSRVAYVSSTAGEQPDIWVMDITGGNRMQITASEESELRPHWSPDGRHVSYLTSRGTDRGLWSMEVSTRRETLQHSFAHARAEMTAPLSGYLGELQLAPSMTQATFTLIQPPSGRRRLYIAGLAPFAARPLSDGTKSVGYPAWSPDERRIAVEIKDGSSTYPGVIDVATGHLRQLADEPGQNWVRSWSPDGRRIAMAVLRDGTWSLRSIDADTGQTSLIVPPLPPRIYVRYPDWSRRGDALVYERGELRGNIWTLALP